MRKKWLVTLVALTMALAAITGGGYALAGDGTDAPEVFEPSGDGPPVTSIDDIDPNVCNAVHNIDACTQEELEELGLVGPATPNSLTAQLLKAQSRWERNGASSYRYQAAWTCFCPREYTAFVDVSVVDGRVTQVSFAEAGFTGDVPDPGRFGPVGELFEFLQDAIGRDAVRIDATFHPELGYPVEVFVDFDERLADEERGFMVRSLSAT